MAQQGIQMDQEKLSCSICLDPLKDPVTIPCGHSYCMSCIRSYWDGEDQRKTYSCPQCRQMFRPRPDLKKNTMMADLVEEVKKTRLQSAAADLCFAGPGDVSCDFCTGRKLKAVKSCLQCLVSYCEQHLQPHYQSPAFKNHKLVEPSKKLQENICSRHNEVMKIFCRSDQQLICSLCSLDEHKGHDTVSAAAERNDKQQVVGLNQKKVQQRIQDREKDVKMLQQQLEAINQSADKAVTNSEKTFKDLISLIQKRKSDVEQQIRSKQTSEVREVTELQEKLKQEIVDLRRRSSELEQLSHTEDHIQFLQNYPLMSHLSESTNPASVSSVHRLQYFDDVTVAVSKTRDKVQEALKEDWTRTSPRQQAVSGLRTLSPAEPKTRDKLQEALKKDWTWTLPKPEDDSRLRTLSQAEPKTRDKLQEALKEDWTRISPIRKYVSGRRTLLREPDTRDEFLQYSCHLTLDPNTSHEDLLLSEGNMKATVKREIQSHPEHPERFKHQQQVLSRESLTGRCYWEVELGTHRASVAVSYKDISRTGPESEFGNNNRSWALKDSFKFLHNRVITHISGSRSSIIGVYLDHSEGILSFYRVFDSRTMTLIHRVKTRFTQPLYAGLRVGGYDYSVEFCDFK